MVWLHQMGLSSPSRDTFVDFVFLFRWSRWPVVDGLLLFLFPPPTATDTKLNNGLDNDRSVSAANSSWHAIVCLRNKLHRPGDDKCVCVCVSSYLAYS